MIRVNDTYDSGERYGQVAEGIGMDYFRQAGRRCVTAKKKVSNPTDPRLLTP